MFSSAYVDSSEWNDTAWKTTEGAVQFNKIVNEARGELDEAKRGQMYAEAQRLINDDGGAIVPMFANYIMGISKKVAHSENVAANWDLDGGKAAERWWFA
jgi:peptide/nickel transport system substrate-binding protein